ncbi:hypothetical protein CALVIDRAFT_89481 [Calocera viscosa TUFC12733]|uniref:Uncharacterized protein n=1 Tax=Calocera viscosa (strain TUFC12733) TaxID=1330018 RepID=A0A167MRP4_CALVF|nr:hypothetical protein CALVIDRAFT_89481 [Calocera viscosa TUFC12733]
MAQSLPAGARGLPVPPPPQRQNPRTGGDAFELYGVGNGLVGGVGVGGVGYAGAHLRAPPAPHVPQASASAQPLANGSTRRRRVSHGHRSSRIAKARGVNNVPPFPC